MSERLIVVDAANVIGARPDGWWRDRAGAVRRLLDALNQAVRRGRVRGDVVVVVEGEARAGVPGGDVEGIRVVHARGVGDDEVVALVDLARQGDPTRQVTVVTADRALRERVSALGADVIGPRTLWADLRDE